MAENTDSNNDIVFLGINFNNFFKHCGCVKRFMDDDESANSEAEDQRKFNENENYQKFLFEEEPQFTIVDQVKQNAQEAANNTNNINQTNFNDGQSYASSTDWTDIEEIPPPQQAPPIQINPAHIYDQPIVNGNMIEEFVTQEPIDFNCIFLLLMIFL